VLDDQLIMDLTMEQGPGRETQVQPPINIWVRYFDLDFARLPRLRLTNRRARRPQTEVRPVVEHDHNWTVEISGADVARPAIIRMRRTDQLGRRYDYWIYRQGEREYEHCDWILENFPNPLHRRGRRWLII
jgi:hypothetical protein